MAQVIKLQSPSYDKRVVTDAAITSGDATLTSDTANFTTSDKSKTIVVYDAGSGGANLTTTIASVTNSTTVELSTTASTTVSGARAVIGNNGEEIVLPVTHATYGGNSLAAIVTLFGGNNTIMDFGQLREVVKLTGVLGPNSSVEAGFANTIHHRDQFRKMRSDWPFEDGTIAGTHWNTATLESDEQDSGTTRSIGKARLVFDVKWDESAGDYEKFFLYGTVADFTFPNQVAAVARDRIPFGVTFFVGTVAVQ